MARGRMIDKTLSTSARRAALHGDSPELAEFAQALYPLLVAHADDWGCQAGDAFTVKHRIDPCSPRPLEAFQEALEALHRVGLIVWYDTAGDGSGDQWIFIHGWFAHQHLKGHTRDGRERPSPPPPETFSKISVCAQHGPVAPTVAQRRPNRTEQKRTEENRTEGPSEGALTAQDGEVEAGLLFPVAGPSLHGTWVLTQEQMSRWVTTYPALDVLAECRKALAYVEANTKQTARGMPRFLVAGLNRATNQPRRTGARAGGLPLPGWAVKR